MEYRRGILSAKGKNKNERLMSNVSGRRRLGSVFVEVPCCSGRQPVCYSLLQPPRHNFNRGAGGRFSCSCADLDGTSDMMDGANARTDLHYHPVAYVVDIFKYTRV